MSEGTEMWSVSSAAGAARVVPATPQSEHAQSLDAPGDGRRSHLVVGLVGKLDPLQLRRCAEEVLERHGEMERPGGSARLDPVEIALRQEGQGHSLSIRAPAERLDGVGLVRTLLELARRSTGAASSSRAAAGETAAVASYFHDLLDDETAGGGMRFWPADPALHTTPELSQALGREERSGGEGAVAAVDAKAVERAVELANASGLSLEAVLLAGWRLVLQRLAPGEEGFLGVYRPGPAEELPETMGFLGRYVPVAVRVGPQSLREAVGATERFLREADRWADFFCWPERRSGRFLAGFRHLDLPPLIEVESAVAEVREVEAPIEELDFELRVIGAAGNPRVEVWMGPSLDSRLAKLLAGSMNELLLASSNRPAPQLLGKPARTLGACAPPDCEREEDVLSLVLAAAEKDPAAFASRQGTAAVTYEQLLGEAAAVARTLQERGVGSGDRVALCAPRRPELLATILGAWWQGASIVLMDPDHPPGRHARILADVDPRLLLCPAGGEPEMRGSEVPVACLGTAAADPSAAIARAPIPGSELAYVMYTSGSSGRPKGVEITHAALANYLRWAAQRYCRPDGHGALAHSSIAADLTLSSLLVPLVAGKTVWMLEESDPESLGRMLGQVERLDFLKLTPGGLVLLREMLSAEELAAAVGHLVLGGEALGRAAVEFLAESALDLLITNEYGPTEATVGSSAYTFGAGDPTRDPVPIGKPVWNTEIEILDGGGSPVPVGVVGEIVILGAGVARGYRRMPAETEARFLLCPGGRRGYRTGDMGRVWPGGDLEYHGRRDQQVKIHGYRVETAEVEAVLLAQADVRAAAVVTVPGAASGLFLSAFVVFKDGRGGAGALAEAEQTLRAELPWYACPDRLEEIGELPLTSAGKLDRDALVTRSKSEGARRPSALPSSERVQILAEIWQRLLDHSPLPEDSFFALGGTSLQALHLVAEARLAGLSLTIRDVVQQRTLARIADAAVPVEPAGGGAGEVGAVSGLPLSPSQLSFLSLRPENAHRWALRWVAPAAGLPDRGRIEEARRAVCRRHPALRCAISLRPPWRASIAAEPGGPPVEFIDLSDLSAERVELRMEEHLREMEMELDPENGVMSLLAVFDRGSAGPALVGWVVHHLVCDLVSLQTINRDLWMAYETGRLEPLDDGYLDWLRAAAPAVESVPVARGEVRERSESLPLWTRLSNRAIHEERLLRILAAAVTYALAGNREAPIRFFVETHGRGERFPYAPAEAVGWLTAFQKVEVGREQLGSRAKVLAAVGQGLNGRPAGSLDLSSVSLNFLGDLGRFPAGAAARLFRGDDSLQPLLFGLELVCWVVQSKLELVWRYDEKRCGGAEVDRLAQAFAGEIGLAGRDGAIDREAPEVSDPTLGAEDLDRIRKAF